MNAETSISHEARRGDLLALGARVLIAPIFVLSGAAKLADPAGTIGYIGSVGLPFAEAGYAAAVAVELIGGLALLVGFKTRIAAIALALFTLAAALTFHFQLGDQNQFIHFFKNLAMAGGLLQIVAFGAGRFSLDRR
ncbi:MAG: LysR family transcriptional regulator [Erythrobacter sp.]|nr:LysR family transcriptional regulator [Erythrobacter sp.]